MTHGHHGSALGVFAIIAAIAFAFGAKTAQVIVGSVLIVCGSFLAYVVYRVFMGTI